MKWIIEFIGQFFGHLLPVALIAVGGVIIVLFIPKYTIFFVFGWAFLVCYLYIKYSKWF